MKTRNNLLSALAALTLAAPAQAAEPKAPVPVQEALAPFDLTAELARAAALNSAADEDLVQRLAECLQDYAQLASLGSDSIEDRVWRNARVLECAAAVKEARIQFAQAEIY